jgi:hypothetical protein
MLGRVKPNLFYGFRVKATLEDPELWYAVNRHFARLQLFVALAMLVGSVGFYFVPNISVDAYALACLGVFLLLSIPAFVMSWRYMKRLKK